MCRFARLLGRVPLAGRLFSRFGCSGNIPNIVRRGSTALTGTDLSRSFGTGETKARTHSRESRLNSARAN